MILNPNTLTNHPGKECKEAHEDISHEEWLKSKKKAPPIKFQLSTKQKKKMDTDKDGDIDAKDVKNLKSKKKGKAKPKSEKQSGPVSKKPKSSAGPNFPY